MRKRGRLTLAATALVIPLIVGGGQLSPVGASTSLAEHDDGPSANSGVVRLWNQHALTALGAQAPPVSGLHMGIVQAAVYDAVNAIDGGHEPYQSGLPHAPADASLDAAVAAAAYNVLIGLVMTPPLSDAAKATLLSAYNATLATVPDGPAEDAGVAAGLAAATAMLDARDDDGRYVPFIFSQGNDVGQWRPLAPGATDPNAWVGNVRTFALDSAEQVRTKGPLPVSSPQYAREYDEVKALGSINSPRTPEQQALAEFYTVNPVPLFNRSFRAISEAEGLSVAEDARLFAMLNVTAADAFIGCWNDKEHWSFWRPTTAIRNGDTDGNPRTVGDPNWSAMLPVPAYPDHPSGFNCSTSAFMHAGWAFFGHDRMDFTVVKVVPNTPDVVREYHRFSDVVDDTIEARLLLGFHFRTPDEQGAWLGEQVARWVDHHYFGATH